MKRMLVGILVMLLLNKPLYAQDSVNKRIVILDDSVHSRSISSKQSRLNLIYTEISQLPDTDVKKEHVNLDWRQEEKIVSVRPNLIIIHLSCFSLAPDGSIRNETPGNNKFMSFLHRFVSTDTRFLIYSGAAFLESPAGQKDFFLRLQSRTGIRIYRLQTFVSRFDSVGLKQLKQLVQNTLAIPYPKK